MATNNTINRIELIGYMGAMPELRYTGNVTPVTNFSLATNRIWRDQAGELHKATDWHRITTWGRLAEVVNQFMALGKRVRVIRGPMAGAEGILSRRKDKYRVVISVDVLMRSVAVEVDITDLELIHSSRSQASVA